MSGHTLLTRIRYSEFATPRRAIPEGELFASIRINLRTIFNTRRRSVLTSDDYGVDPEDLMSGTATDIATFAQELQRTITLYEPRLSQITVRSLPKDPEQLTIKFEISATVKIGLAYQQFSFEASLNRNRTIDIK